MLNVEGIFLFLWFVIEKTSKFLLRIVVDRIHTYFCRVTFTNSDNDEGASNVGYSQGKENTVIANIGEINGWTTIYIRVRDYLCDRAIFFWNRAVSFLSKKLNKEDRSIFVQELRDRA